MDEKLNDTQEKQSETEIDTDTKKEPKLQQGQGRWTLEQRRKFLSLYKQGATVEFIAKRVGASPTTIKTKITQLHTQAKWGGVVRLWTEEHDALLAKMVTEDQTNHKVIARLMQRSPAAVLKRMELLQIYRYHRWTKDEERSIRSSIKKMANRFGATDKQLISKIRNMYFAGDSEENNLDLE